MPKRGQKNIIEIYYEYRLEIKNLEFKGHPTKNKGILKVFQPKIKIF